MFERFTHDARAVVVSTQDVCRRLGVDEVRPVHLLLALTEEGSGVADLLAAHGITADAVNGALGAPRPAPREPLGDDDAAALRSLGIDLDAIRDAVDRQFGEGALDGALAESAAGDLADDEPRDDLDDDRSERGRFGLGGHVRFSRGAKKVLELAVREAIRSRSGEIRTEHIALGLLRTDDDAVRLVLTAVGADPRAVRADLEGRGRRSA